MARTIQDKGSSHLRLSDKDSEKSARGRDPQVAAFLEAFMEEVIRKV